MKVGDLVRVEFGVPEGFSDIGEITRVDGYYIDVKLTDSWNQEIIVERYECELEVVNE